MGADAIAAPELQKRHRETPLTFFDLPTETQAGIIAHVSLSLFWGLWEGMGPAVGRSPAVNLG